MRLPDHVDQRHTVFAFAVKIRRAMDRFGAPFGEAQDLLRSAGRGGNAKNRQQMRIHSAHPRNCRQRISVRLKLHNGRPLQDGAVAINLLRLQANDEVVEILAELFRVVGGPHRHIAGEHTRCPRHGTRDRRSAHKRQRSEHHRHRDFPGRRNRRAEIPVGIKRHPAQTVDFAPEIHHRRDIFPSVYAVARRTHDLRHIGPDTVISRAVERTAVAGAADRHLAVAGLLLQRTNRRRSVRLIAERQIFLVLDELQRAARTAEHAGKTGPAAVFLRLGHHARIVGGTFMAAVSARRHAGAAADATIAAHDIFRRLNRETGRNRARAKSLLCSHLPPRSFTARGAGSTGGLQAGFESPYARATTSGFRSTFSMNCLMSASGRP